MTGGVVRLFHSTSYTKSESRTYAERRLLLLDMALGAFTSLGVIHLRMQREADVSNLGDPLLYSLDDVEEIATEKGVAANSWMRSSVTSIRQETPVDCSLLVNCGQLSIS